MVKLEKMVLSRDFHLGSVGFCFGLLVCLCVFRNLNLQKSLNLVFFFLSTKLKVFRLFKICLFN